MTVPAADGKLRFWRNTSMATLAPGTVGTLPQGVLGYEWDSDVDNGARPAGPVRRVVDHAAGVADARRLRSHWASGTATHSMTEYRASSGALVFSAGTIDWSWGLDATHDGSRTAGLARHAAGHRQPPRRHGRAAGHGAPHPPAGDPVHGYHAAGGHDHLADCRQLDHQRQRVEHLGHRVGPRGRHRGRRRGLDRRRFHLAPRRRHDELDLHAARWAARDRSRSSSGRPTTAATSRRARPACR